MFWFDKIQRLDRKSVIIAHLIFMIYTKDVSIELMNKWGKARKPFLFIIDFEMNKIRLFPADRPLPLQVRFQFPCSPVQTTCKRISEFTFYPYPVSFPEYSQAFTEVENQIQAGNSFLLNLTFPTRIETNMSLSDIFDQSRAKYKLIVDREFVVFSPEIFINIRDGIISSYPMKGTIDATIPMATEKIMKDEKETAEHYTIVDLIRNDLSMVATDVTVKRFRYIDKIKTHRGEILQVSSEIEGKLPMDYHTKIGDILFCLLPAGSVTGAPKQKTVGIIKKVEPIERGYYTGVCGYFDGTNLDSAVMIRFIEMRDRNLWFRSGGGITCNSFAESEYQELINKVYVPVV